MNDCHFGGQYGSHRGTASASHLIAGNHLADSNFRFGKAAIANKGYNCLSRQYGTYRRGFAMLYFKGAAHDITPVSRGLGMPNINAEILTVLLLFQRTLGLTFKASSDLWLCC